MREKMRMQEAIRLRAARNGALRGVLAHYEREQLVRVDPPLIVPVTGACENVETLFALVGHDDLHLTQTGQLSLEVALQDDPGVYCVLTSFRDEVPDERHLREFCLVEEEFSSSLGGTAGGWRSPEELFDVLLTRVTQAVTAMLKAAVGSISEIADASPTADVHGIAESGDKWERVTYEEAIELLNRSGRFSSLDFGDDFRADHEIALVDLVAEEHGSPTGPCFVTHFPESIKFFTMKTDPKNPSCVLSADLLLPGVGECVGAAVREEDVSALVARLESSSMLRALKLRGGDPRREFNPYLEVMSSGRVPPHAGYGIGLERIIQFILGERDIRRVSERHALLSRLHD